MPLDCWWRWEGFRRVREWQQERRRQTGGHHLRQKYSRGTLDLKEPLDMVQPLPHFVSEGPGGSRVKPQQNQGPLSPPAEKNRPETSLAVQWLRPTLPNQGIWVWSLVRQWRSHMTCGLKTKTLKKKKKQYYNKFNKDFKNSPPQKILKRTKQVRTICQILTEAQMLC